MISGGNKNLSWSVDDTLSNGATLTIQTSGVYDFTVKTNPKPLFFWNADGGISSLSRKTSWDTANNSTETTAIVAPGSNKSFLYDLSFSESAALGGLVLNSSEMYLFRKSYSDFDITTDYSIRTIVNNSSISGGSIEAGDAVTGVSSGATGTVIDVDTGATTTRILYSNIEGSGSVSDESIDFINTEVMTTNTGVSMENAEPEGVFRTFNYKIIRYWNESDEYNSIYTNVDGYSPLAPNYSVSCEGTDSTKEPGSWSNLTAQIPEDWVTVQINYKAGSQDATDGIWNFNQNGKLGINAVVKMSSTEKPGNYDTIYQEQVSNGTQSGSLLYHDCLYVDDSYHRVIISDSSEWDETVESKQEIQLPITWTEDTITVEMRIGSLSNISDCFLYVFDALGVEPLNTAGVPLVESESDGTYATDINGLLLSPHPWLQANDATTNLITNSNDISDVYWVKDGCTDAVDTSLDILGQAIAQYATLDTSTGNHRVRTPSISFVAGETSVYSTHLKYKSHRYIRISVGGVSSLGLDLNTERSVLVDVLNKTIAPTADPSNSKIEILGNGWMRVFLRITPTDSGNNYLYPLFIADDGVSSSFLGDGVSGVYIGGSHYEIGSSMGVYTPTTTTAASIDQLDYIYPAANIDPADSDIKLQFKADGRDCDILNIGGVPLLTYGDVADGNELVVNGTFDTNMDGWESSTDVSAAIEWEAPGYGKATAIPGDNLGLYSLVNLVDGSEYILTFDLVSTNNLSQVRVGTVNAPNASSSFDIIPSGAAVIGINEVKFTQGFARAYIYIGGRDDVNDIVIDDVSLQKTTKGIKLDDGSGNIITFPTANGTHPIQVVLTGSTMALYVDDDVIISERPYVPIAAGDIVSNASHYALRTAV